MSERCEYQVVLLGDDGRVEACFGCFPSDDEFVRRILALAKTQHGDRAVLQRRPWPVFPGWETIA